MGCMVSGGRWGRGRQLAVPLAGLAMLLVAGLTAAQERVALVIGNGAYTHQGRLPNPPNDAEDVGAALDRLGFRVTTVIDADLDAMLDALDAFESRSAGADMSLVFFAGHGVQVAGTSYLLPVGAELADEDRVDYEAVPLDRLLRKTAGARLQLVFLDACRNNPFATRMARTRGTQARGLKVVAPRATDSGEVLVALSTAPGEVARDGEDRNSPFAAGLLEHIEEPGLEVGLLLRRVKRTVEDRTNDRQSPWWNASLGGEGYYLAGGPPAAPAASPLPIPTAAELYEQVGSAAAGDGVPSGLKYRVLVEGFGRQLVAVDPYRTFRSGEEIVLGVTPNIDGFLYAVLHGSDGNWQPIRPARRIPLDYSPRGREVLIPPGNWFRFDSTPGTERLYLYLSPERDDGILDALLGGGCSVAAAQTREPGAVNDLPDGIASMNLVLGRERTPEASGAQGQALFMVNPTGGSVCTLIELLHR